jgi:hypothetical protein
MTLRIDREAIASPLSVTRALATDRIVMACLTGNTDDQRLRPVARGLRH